MAENKKEEKIEPWENMLPTDIKKPQDQGQQQSEVPKKREKKKINLNAKAYDPSDLK